MSGILGVFRQNLQPVEPQTLQAMAGVLERRGPDRTGLWHDGSVGLGHTLLATTPELAWERQPWQHSATGCVIVADVRLDNRPELLRRLSFTRPPAEVGDAELIVHAYLRWGADCVQQLLGDFAFVLWDPREARLFAARDRAAMRPLYYHHQPGRLLVLASEPRAILRLPDTPGEINEGRIADFLVNPLEGIDKTSTFYQAIQRLPPAHWLLATRDALSLQCYWQPEPGPRLQLASDEEYVEAFLEVFTEAVRCRMRGHGPVGAMLSGGMDSGSVVAIARTLTNDGAPLPTFSAVGPAPGNCIETRTIDAALEMTGLEPHRIGYHELDRLVPELAASTLQQDEPFDAHMTMIRAVYLLARERGVRVVLDGVGGDIAFMGSWDFAERVRSGGWAAAGREAVSLARYWGEGKIYWPHVYQSLRQGVKAVLPTTLHTTLQRFRGGIRAGRKSQGECPDNLTPEFRERVDLAARLHRLAEHREPGIRDPAKRHAQGITHTFQVVGRERYDRTAAAFAIEPRDPFFDPRVIAFALRLPEVQKTGAGWPKILMRRAMAGRLPEAVRWRQGKGHVGWHFTTTVARQMQPRLNALLTQHRERLVEYLHVDALQPEQLHCVQREDWCEFDRAYSAAMLAAWLCDVESGLR